MAALEGPHLPSSHRLAASLGVVAHDLQLKKASFFGDDDLQDLGEFVCVVLMYNFAALGSLYNKFSLSKACNILWKLYVLGPGIHTCLLCN